MNVIVVGAGKVGMAVHAHARQAQGQRVRALYFLVRHSFLSLGLCCPVVAGRGTTGKRDRDRRKNSAGRTLHTVDIRRMVCAPYAGRATGTS